MDTVTDTLRITIVPGAALSPAVREDIIALCTRAYEEDFAAILATFPDATHVLGHLDDELVSHALWIPRTLTYNGAPLLSAYVEATETEDSASWQRSCPRNSPDKKEAAAPRVGT